MQIVRFGIILTLLILLGWGVHNLIGKKNALQEDVVKLTASTSALVKENKELLEQIEYFKRPENVLKELKSQFNYREEGERLIIIVPGGTLAQ